MSDFLSQSSEIAGDPLSDTLMLLKARCVTSGGLRASGEWALQFIAPQKVKFIAITHGQCVLCFDDHRPPIHLSAGEAVLINGTPGFRLATDPRLPARAASDFYAARASTDKMLVLGDGTDFHALGGHIDVDPHSRTALLSALPEFVHIRANMAEAANIGWLLGQLMREMQTERIGSRLSVSQLTHLIFIQLMRTEEMAASALPVGWLKGSCDRQIGIALRLMHADPARSWRLADLARASGMSRTSFAERFKSVVGTGPLGYLRQWRIRLAEHALRETDQSVADIGYGLGYASEAAFSTAFARLAGMPPRRFRQMTAN